MNHAQKYLAQANRHIAELVVQIAHQRAIIKALDTGQRSEMAESLLDALEASLRLFENHRMILLRLQRISECLAAGCLHERPELVTTQWAWSFMTKPNLLDNIRWLANLRPLIQCPTSRFHRNQFPKIGRRR